MPVTINDAEYDNSYVCSPYTAYATYPRLEVDNIPGRILPAALRVLLHSAGPVLRAAQVNRVVCVNNWLLSTNLYPAISPEFVPEVTRHLAEQFPLHAIVFRSLNYVTNRELCERLAHSGYLLAPSRQIFLIDGRTNVYLRKQNARWDRKLLESTKYRVVPHESLQTSDAVRIEQMYRSLYVEKYSQHNPQPTVEMIEELLRRRLLSMRGCAHRMRSSRRDCRHTRARRRHVDSFAGLRQVSADQVMFVSHVDGAGDARSRRTRTAIESEQRGGRLQTSARRRALFGVYCDLLPTSFLAATGRLASPRAGDAADWVAHFPEVRSVTV